MGTINTYRRGDGLDFKAEEGSASDKLMAKSGEFELLEGETETGESLDTETATPAKAAPKAKTARAKK